jgi:hypothetical protein
VKSGPRIALIRSANPPYAAIDHLRSLLRFIGKIKSDRAACDKITRRANHSTSCPALAQKIFLFPFDPNHRLIPAVPHPMRGAYRDRHGRWVWDAMAATASGAKAPGETLVADGEVVWS